MRWKMPKSSTVSHTTSANLFLLQPKRNHPMINLSSFIRPVPGYSNSNWTMYRLSGNGTSNHYFIAGRSGNIVASGKRKHCVEVWNNAGTASKNPMSLSV